MSAYEQKLISASAIVSDHNSALSGDSPKIVWETVVSKIKESGGTTDASLREMTWEDLQLCGLPRVLARQIANQVFRKSDEPAVIAKPLTSGRVTMMTLAECFSLYDITGESNAPITDRLLKESKGLRCVVLNEDGSVNAQHSATALREIKDGLSDRDVFTDKGKVYRVVKVGERPDVYFDENPLMPGQPLRSGTCDRSNRSWDNITQNVRQLLYIAVTQTKELTIMSVDDIHRILDSLKALAPSDALQYVLERYPRANIRFMDLQQTNQLPMLKIKSGYSKNGGSNDPFYSKHVRT